MKIEKSSIAMESMHRESSYVHVETMSMEAAASKDTVGAILTLSKEGEGKSYTDSMKSYQKQEKEAADKRRQENEARMMQQMLEQKKTGGLGQLVIPDGADMKIKMMRQILAALRGERISPEEFEEASKTGAEAGMPTISLGGGVIDLRSAFFKKMDSLAAEMSKLTVKGGSESKLQTKLQAQPLSIGTTASGSLWQKITVSSGFSSEFEATTFASKGLVKTSDGRSIDFNIEVSMTRSFMTEINLLDVKEYIKTDPLVINLDTQATSVTDQKFLFDLDSDGRKEKISFAGPGSGFLALDRNGDGIINDGSELFGTKSGDGFADLAAYDEDGNGWIDEGDSIYDKLIVWTKDEEGRDYMLDLKKADVGAIYLGSQETQFSLKNEDHALNAEVRKTGIYLKESTGVAGTLNHIDLVVG